jgi:TonB family protein
LKNKPSCVNVNNMNSDKLFGLTFLISLVAHGVILSQSPNFSFLPGKNQERTLKVSYIKSVQEPAAKGTKNPTLKAEPFLKLAGKITAAKIAPPPYVDRESIFKGNKVTAKLNPNFVKPVFIKPDIIAIKKKITLPPIEMDKINNPTYISYYQIVREKIKRAAYQNYSGSEIGEVSISFVISDDGYLKDLRLLEDKSSPNPYLRDIAIKSIKDASPFPNFPKELDYPRLSFNLAITFEVE